MSTTVLVIVGIVTAAAIAVVGYVALRRTSAKPIEVTVSNGARALLAMRLKGESWAGAWTAVEARHDLHTVLALDEIQVGDVAGHDGLHIPVEAPPPPADRSTAALVAHDRAHKAAMAAWLRDGALYKLSNTSARLALSLAQRTPLPGALGPSAVVFVRDLRSALNA